MPLSNSRHFLAFAPIVVIGVHVAGCSDTPNTTSTSSGSSSSSSSSSSSGDVSSSSSSSSVSSTSSSSGMGGAGGMGGSGGMAGVGGSGGMVGSGGAPMFCVPGSSSSCYSGPAGTMGVGLCKGGMSICNAEGTAYGSCLAEVLPAPEDCSQPGDENCNGPSADCSAGAWSKRFGDFDGQYGRSIAADSAGNVYVTGIFYSALDFGAGAMTATDLDGFLVKFDPLGNFLWSKHLGGAGTLKPLSLAVDSVGNVVVTGYFAGNTDFGGGALTAIDANIFVAKYDPAGSHLWSKQYGAAGEQYAEVITFDNQNNIIIGSVYANAVDFGGGALTTTNFGFAVAKLDGNGNHIWSKGFNNDLGQPQLMALATDGSGNVGFGGYFSGTVNFGGGTLTASSSYDMFLTKFDMNGQHVWSKRYGGAQGQNPNGMGFDTAGNLYAGGSFQGTIDFGGGVLTTAGNDDIWLAKLDPAGNHIWSKRFGDSQQQFITGLAVTKSGDLAMAITFGGTLNFGASSITSAGNLDIGHARFDSAGNNLWSRRAGDAGLQDAYAVAFDPTGHVLGTGGLVGTADFGQGPLMTDGSSDLYVVKLAP